MPIDIPWVCKTCGKECYPWDPFVSYVTIAGIRKRRTVVRGTVLEHRMDTGHQQYRRKVGPRI